MRRLRRAVPLPLAHEDQLGYGGRAGQDHPGHALRQEVGVRVLMDGFVFKEI